MERIAHESHDRFASTQTERPSSYDRVNLIHAGDPVVLPGPSETRDEVVTRAGEPFATPRFRYGPDSDDPPTGTRGGEWACSAADAHLPSTDEIVPGDRRRLSFALAPPIPPPNGHLWVADAMRRAGNPGGHETRPRVVELTR